VLEEAPEKHSEKEVAVDTALCGLFIINMIMLSINIICNTTSPTLPFNILCNILHFNYAKSFSPSEYLILPIYFYILTLYIVYLYYSYYSVDFTIVVLYCNGTRISFGIYQVLSYLILIPIGNIDR